MIKTIGSVKLDFKWIATIVFAAGAIFVTVTNTADTICKIQDKTIQHETRITILETQYQDIKEIKSDVKELLKRDR